MSKNRKRHNKSKNPLVRSSLTYAQALEATGQARRNLFTVIEYPKPDFDIGTHTQNKLASIVEMMDGIGKSSGDFPKEKFDQAITFHKLPIEAIEWLEKAGIPARRTSPLSTLAYRDLFASEKYFPIEKEIIEKFFSHFIHCLLVETQIIIAKQYYQGLGLHQPKKPSILEAFPNIAPQFKAELKEAEEMGMDLLTIEVDQLHGRIFLEYCTVMIRAQWDKLVSLSCLMFGLRQNWGSISDGLKALDQHINTSDKLDPGCKHYSKIFLDIANERLSEKAWLKGFRDSLLHQVGQHSLGVAPQRTSSFTTSELWDKMCDEHNWLREAIMVILLAFVFKGSKTENKN